MGQSKRRTAVSTSLLAAVFVSAAGMAACTLLVDTSDLDQGPPPIDGGPADAMTKPDATIDAAIDADAGIDGCVSPGDPARVLPFDDARWTLRGSAVVDDAGVLLTPQTGDLAGGIWSNDIVTFDRFEVTAALRVDDGDGDKQVADGITFSWVPGAVPASAGEKGGGLGAGGLKGYAVALDTFTDPKTDPMLEVLDSSLLVADSQWVLTKAPAPSPDFVGSEHTLRIRLDSGGVVTVSFDGIVTIDHFTIPKYVVGRGHWGFTAATGGVSSLQRLTAVTFVDLKSCP